MPSARRVVVVAVLIVASVLAAHGVAYAHAMLVSEDPIADSVVATSPHRIRLVFSEQIEPTLASISLVASTGHAMRLQVAGDPRDVDAIVAPLASELAEGAYRVVWHVVSADGHPVGGSFVFWVGRRTGVAPPAAAEHPAAASWGPSLFAAPLIPAALRGLAVGCAMALAGLLVFVVWEGGEAPAATPRAHVTVQSLAVMAPILAALHFVAWTVNAAPDHGLTTESIARATTSGVGRFELWRIAFAVLALWALSIARRPPLALAFALIVVALSGATGHSAAIQPVVATPARSLHLFAGAAWLGGILWLIFCDRTDIERFAREASRVSALALWAVFLVAVSGLGMAALFLASPSDLVRSGYGVVLLAKIAGLVTLIAFGAHYRRRVLPSLRTNEALADRFAVAVRRELVVMLVVLLLGGWLAYMPPPREPVGGGSSSDTSVE
ncbi:MAG TPA: copper resistance protein CopC [Gemmatimonadaceae bacterium]|nr:copper resistance protein CopC [Gemmatimonadaceae bacterium]